MIGHDDISPNSPAMASVSRAPFFHENSGCFVSSENSLSTIDARSDVIDREIDPNAFEPSQMFMHSRMFVAEGVELGEPKDLPRAQSSRSAPAATTSSLRGKNRFRVATGNFADRNPAEAANERSQ
jgi:hypothetical protein